MKCSITPAKLKTPAKKYFPAKNYFPPNLFFLKKSKSYFFLKLPKIESDFKNYFYFFKKGSLYISKGHYKGHYIYSGLNDIIKY